MDTVVNRGSVKNLLKEHLTYDAEDFKIMVIGYKLFLLDIAGNDVSDLDRALRLLDKSKEQDINEQFLSLTDNPLANQIVIKDESDLVELGYKVVGYRLNSELKQLEGIVNAIKLSELTSYIGVLIKAIGSVKRSCLGKKAFEEIVEAQIENCCEIVDNIFNQSEFIVESRRLMAI